MEGGRGFMRSCSRLAVSVIMPMKNAQPFVAGAIRSVLNQQALDGDDLELIVVDDHSTDGSIEEVLQIAETDERLRLASSPGEGIAAAINHGLELARGKYFARCDADDLYPPRRLAQQVRWLEDHPELGAVCGAFAITSPDGVVLSDLECGAISDYISGELSGGIVRTHFCTFLTRTDVLQKIGGAREFFKTGEDIDLQLRLGENCKVWYQPLRRYLYRLHMDSVTHQVGNSLTAYYDHAARRFQMQRIAGELDDLQRNQPPEPQILPSIQAPLAQQIQGILLGTAWQQHMRGRKLRSILTGLRAGFRGPNDLSIWRSVAALVLKRSGKSKKRSTLTDSAPILSSPEPAPDPKLAVQYK